eukprot:4105136-Alexandrium_andersonii.AAC.1
MPRSYIRGPPIHGDEKKHASPGPLSNRITALAESARAKPSSLVTARASCECLHARESVLRSSQQQWMKRGA